MQNKNRILLSCLALVALAACGGGGGNSNQPKPSVLGKATEPGYMPDGTKTEPLTKEQAETFSAALAKKANIDGALPKNSKDSSSSSSSSSSQPNLGGNSSIGGDSEKIKKLAEQIKSQCEVQDTGSPSSNVDGSKSSGTINAKYGAKASGQTCPFESETVTSMNGTYNSSNDSMSMNAAMTLKSEYKVKNEEFLKETGVEAGTAEMNFRISMNSSKSSTSMGFEGTGASAWGLNDSVNLVEKIYAEGSFSGSSNSSDSSAMNMKFAVVYDVAGLKVLIQMFMSKEPGKDAKAKIYLNGQDSASLNVPGIAPAVSNLVQLSNLAVQF